MDFVKFITDLDHGRVVSQLGDQLAKVSEAVDDTGRAGSMTIKISITKEGSMATVAVDSAVKTPQHPMHGTLFFFDDKHGLQREDPRQLKLRDVSAPRVVELQRDRKSAAAEGDGESNE